MSRESVQKLRLDRRLIGRRDWISPNELEQELAALPDSGHKATTLGKVEDEAKGVTEPSGAGDPASVE